MNIIEQEARYVILKNPLIKAERAGRTCYQSEQSSTCEDAAKFVKRALQNKHFSIFEHVIFVFVFNENLGSYYHYLKLLETAGNHPSFSNTVNEIDGRNIISINFRFLMEAYENEPLLGNLVRLIYNRYPELFLEEVTVEDNEYNLSGVDCLTSEEFQLLYETQLTKEEILKHIYFSFVLQTDRGVMAELTRHRLNAFSVSSTRYINFDKKFGGIPIIKPVTGLTDIMRVTLYNIEIAYSQMLANGATPQEARAILPNCLWTEIFTTANVQQWIHIFELRLSKRAHPQIRDLAEQVYRLVNSLLVNHSIDMQTMDLVLDEV